MGNWKREKAAQKFVTNLNKNSYCYMYICICCAVLEHYHLIYSDIALYNKMLRKTYIFETTKSGDKQERKYPGNKPGSTYPYSNMALRLSG